MKSFVVLLICNTLVGCHWVSNAISRKAVESREFSNRAQIAHENGEYGRATQLLTKAIEADPLNADLHRKLARAHLANGNHAAALEELRYVAAAQPDDADVYTELAQVYFSVGDDRQSSIAVRDALDRDSSHLEALSLHAKLLERESRMAEAEKVYLRILELDRENTDARLRLAVARLKASKPDQAAPLLRSICQCPQSTPAQRAEARWALGIAYGRVGRWEEASSSLAGALPHLKKPTANEWYRLAYAQRQSGDHEGAHVNLARALRIDPAHPGAIELAGRTRRTTSKDRFNPIRYAAAHSLPTKPDFSPRRD